MLVPSYLIPRKIYSQSSPPAVVPDEMKSRRATWAIIPQTFLLQRSIVMWKAAVDKTFKSE